jgi:hypothetical protein
MNKISPSPPRNDEKDNEQHNHQKCNTSSNINENIIFIFTFIRCVGFHCIGICGCRNFINYS